MSEIGKIYASICFQKQNWNFFHHKLKNQKIIKFTCEIIAS